MKQPNSILKNVRLAGFTVVELCIVIIVIVILAIVVTVSYRGISEKAANNQLITDLTRGVDLLELDYLELKSYPPSASAVNDGKGFVTSNGTVLAYRPASDLQSYCLQASMDQSGTGVYIVTQDSQPAVGACPEVQLPTPTSLAGSVTGGGTYDTYNDYSIVTITWAGVAPTQVANYEVDGCSVATVANPSAGTRSCSSDQIAYPAQTYGPLSRTFKVRAVSPDGSTKSAWASVTIQYN